MSEARDEINELGRTLEITRAARFAASKRLSDRHRASMYVISTLSTGVILMSIMPNCITLSQKQNQILLSCSIVLSVFIIFTSILDSSSEFHYKGMVLHDSARQVGTVMRDLFARRNDADENLWNLNRELQYKYRKILLKCPETHDEVDYLSVQIAKPHLFNNIYSKKLWVRLPQKAIKILKYHIKMNVWVLPPIGVAGTVAAVIYFEIFK